MSNPNGELIARFYSAFDRHDGAAMAACYAPDAHFSDVRRTLRVELHESSADDVSGTARWVARYTFAETGRPVVNDVRSTFRFADGLIAEQRDVFGFHQWARQALGLPGLLLGWTPVVRSAVRRKARAGLAASMTDG